jgi:hypothetical protein
MYEQYYETWYFTNGQWQCFGGIETPIKTYNKINAKRLADEVRIQIPDAMTMLIHVERSLASRPMTQEQYWVTIREGVEPIG